jgi:hypothetical protein
MRRFKNWLASKLNPDMEPPDTRLWQANLRPDLKARPKSKAVEPVTYSADAGGRIEDSGPGKNVLIRNKYVREDSGTHETLKIFRAADLDQDDEGGQDPYNSGRFDRSKSWASHRSRK